MAFRQKNRLEEITLNDPNLRPLMDDPRLVKDDSGKIMKTCADVSRKGHNTESFDPNSTLVRPDMRIVVGPNRESYFEGKENGTRKQPLKHDDVVIVPEFFCNEDDLAIYYKLIEEMRGSQEKGLKNSEWISWHEGAHLISKGPTGSKTYREIQEKISRYFGINNKSVGTRFNWYRDSSDWKPFHHDSAAYNPQRGKD